MTTLQKVTRKELLALPVRQCNTTKQYDYLIVFGSRKRHESGFNLFVVVGCKHEAPVEIVSLCSDVINWELPAGRLNVDCLPKSNALRFWCNDALLRVGPGLSSLFVKAIQEKQR